MSEVGVPEWVDQAIVYAVMPDRFAPHPPGARALPGDAEAYWPWDRRPVPWPYATGGTLDGIAARLDHLERLGVTVLYLSPIWPSPAYHRYKPTDWVSVCPLLGGDEAFAGLLAAAHARGLRVMLDVVYNHVSTAHPWFASLAELDANSPYRDFFVVEDPSAPSHGPERRRYRCWNGRWDMPQVNHAHPQVREAILASLAHWARLGVDGFRFDAPAEMGGPEEWQEIRARVRGANPGAVIVGEEWGDPNPFLTGRAWDGATHFGLCMAIRRFAGGGQVDERLLLPGSPEAQAFDGEAFLAEVAHLVGRTPWENVQASWTFVNSLDLARFVTVCRGDERRAELAAAALLTLPGTPVIVYGDEVGMAGGLDPYNRATMDWAAIEGLEAGAAASPAATMLAAYRRLIGWRRASAALRSGRFVPLAARGAACAFARVLDADAENPSDAGARAVVALNAGEAEAWLDLPGSGRVRVPGLGYRIIGDGVDETP